jgi:hypothetical protein
MLLATEAVLIPPGVKVDEPRTSPIENTGRPCKQRRMVEALVFLQNDVHKLLFYVNQHLYYTFSHKKVIVCLVGAYNMDGSRSVTPWK